MFLPFDSWNDTAMLGELVKAAADIMKAAASEKSLEESLKEETEESLEKAIEESLSDFFHSKEKHITKYPWKFYKEYKPKRRLEVYSKNARKNWPIFTGHKFALGVAKP